MHSLRHVTLDDKYTLDQGRVLLSGVQALVRLPMLQYQRDRDAGLNTAGFISGYRGSPLGGYDSALRAAREHLALHRIHFQPGLNEDLAATAVWGTQQLDADPQRCVDGVFALWYGKGPGVDRSGDPFKHGNLAGSARYGGVLLACGDDHSGKSSTVAHHSEPALIAARIPVLYPATVQEVLDFGLHGWALSRYAGVWVGLKCVNETAESTATVDIDLARPVVVRPELPVPPEGVNYQSGYGPLNEERHLLNVRLPRVQAFARANALDRVVQPPGVLGIVSAGKAFRDVMQALQRLGIDAERARELGIGVYKPGLVWPLEPQQLREFAADCRELLVAEEKSPVIEQQAARILYDLESRPRLLGRRDADGRALLPGDAALDPLLLALVIGERLRALGRTDAALEACLAELNARLTKPVKPASDKVLRLPYFCSGCPHNRSTRVPEGSRALSGIGCHTMAIWMDRETAKPTQMGGEGMNWAGMAPFTKTRHVFQNLGDGTYAHSGLLAIRAARLSGANITFRILFNDAVAMTGGQPVEGPLTVPAIAEQVRAEGIERIVVVTEDTGRYRRVRLPAGVRVHDRRRLDAIQRELREVSGVSVLIYDQTCAAEKRRRRKRGRYPDPPRRVFINPEVCEGCGDCSVQSNCVSLQPLETAFGRKRRIDQSSCNKDFSCLEGFCPSFVTVEGGERRNPDVAALPEAWFDDLPEPAVPTLADTGCNVLITGIGGTGVVTIGALLAMAAHLEGHAANVYDMTGLAQKNGAVFSHLRLAATPDTLHAAAIGAGEADLLLGGDLVVSGSAEALRALAAGRSRAVVNGTLIPTAQFLHQPDLDFEQPRFMDALRGIVGERLHAIAATELAQRLLGDSIGANLLLVGHAWQLGALPLSRAAIRHAIELNGVAVEFNQRAFELGRLLAHAPHRLAQSEASEPVVPTGLDELIAQRAEHLAAYQNAAYAVRFRDLVDKVRRVEAERVGGSTELTATVADVLSRLMAYKDEYEVARLFTERTFRQRLEHEFAGEYRLRFHLAPPLLAGTDPTSGRPRKRAFGPWVMPLFRMLARIKFLRGTAFDIFGYTAERRWERKLIDDYRELVDEVLDALTARNHALAVELVGLAGRIRGFGPVKRSSMARIDARQGELLARYRAMDAAAETSAGLGKTPAHAQS